MKKNVLLGSVLSIVLATTTAVVTALTVTAPEIGVRLMTVASILGLASVGLFFVGLATPSNNSSTASKGKVNGKAS